MQKYCFIKKIKKLLCQNVVNKVSIGKMDSYYLMEDRKSSNIQGMAIKIKIIAGAIVHATSINCPSNKNRFVKLLITSIIIIYVTTVKIIIIIIIKA